MKSRSGASGRYGLITSKFDTSSSGIFSGGRLSTSPVGRVLPRRPAGPTNHSPSPARPDQHQPFDPPAMLHGEFCRQPSTEGEADQAKLVDAERVEQVEVMHDIIMHVAQARVVGRVT